MIQDNDLATCDVFVYSVNDRGLKELAGERDVQMKQLPGVLRYFL